MYWYVVCAGKRFIHCKCVQFMLCVLGTYWLYVLHIYHSSGRCEISTAITEVKHHLHRLDDVVHQSLFAQLAAPPLLLSDALPGSQELLLRGSLDPVSSVLLGWLSDKYNGELPLGPLRCGICLFVFSKLLHSTQVSSWADCYEKDILLLSLDAGFAAINWTY